MPQSDGLNARLPPGAAWRNEIAVCGLIALAYLLVWPVGDYAIMDDWAFTKSLEHLHFDGELKILDWNPMSLVGQLFWGFLFTNLFGFSFTVAKISVVAVSAVEAVAFLRLLALCGVGRNLALAGVLTLVFNPLHFVHSFMYMTDVPAVAWEVLAVFCYVKGLTGGAHNLAWLGGGSLAAGEAFLIRQHGILVPAALLVYLIVFDRRRCTAKFLVAALMPASVVVTGFTLWYERVHGPTSTHVNSLRLVAGYLGDLPVEDVPYMALTFFVYGGWFLIPIALAVRPGALQLGTRSRRLLFLAVAWTAFNTFGYYAVTSGDLFPYLTDVVTPHGYYFPNEFIIGRRPFLWGRPVAAAVSVVSLVAGLAFVHRLLAVRPLCGRGATGGTPAETCSPPDRSDPAAIATRFLAVLLALQLAYVFVTAPILFDRHLLVFAPTLVALFCLLAPRGASVRPIPYMACLLPVAFYSVAATHDLHSLSRTAFRAGEDLIAEGVEAGQINGGYAFDAWQTYEIRQRQVELLVNYRPWWRGTAAQHIAFEEQSPEAAISLRRRQWWLGIVGAGIETKYAVSCSPPRDGHKERYQTYRTYEYRNWWPWEIKSVYVVQDTGDPGKGSPDQ